MRRSDLQRQAPSPRYAGQPSAPVSYTHLDVYKRQLYLRARSRSSGTTVPVLDRHFPIIEDVKGCPVFQIDNLFRFGTGSIIGKRGCRT